MSDTQTPQADTRKIRRSFYAISLLLPFLILTIIELGLRVIGFGGTPLLFIEQGAPPGYLQPNPDIILRYFASRDSAPDVAPDTVFFAKHKAPDTYRIFVQGGSTAAGFPYGRWGSLQGMLGQRLKRLYPEHEFEIVNTAMSAVNSYSLLDFVDEIIDKDPDLVLIYTGHNEYLGVLGAGSAFSTSALSARGGRFLTLLYLRVKSLGIYQLMAQTYQGLSASSIDDDMDQRSVMSRAAKGRAIPINGPVFEAGVRQFSGNLAHILKKYQRAGIPVIIGTLVSNEKDLAPFSSIAHIDWNDYVGSLESSDANEKMAELLSLTGEKESEISAYKQGLLYDRLSEYDKAREAFGRARDLDSLRFRAPAVFNDIIRRRADQYDAHIAEVEAYLRAESTRGILGEEHLFEHVHPNARGYFLLAEAYVDTLLANAKKIGLDPPPLTFSRAQAWRDIPLTTLARDYADYKIARLMRDYPFTRQALPPPAIDTGDFDGQMLQKRSRGENWLSLQQKLLEHYQKTQNLTEAARVAGILSDALVDHHQAASVAGRLYRGLGDLDLAIYYQRRASRLAPGNTVYLLELAQSYFMSDRINRSIETLDAVLVIDPDNKNALFFRNKLRAMNEG